MSDEGRQDNVIAFPGTFFSEEDRQKAMENEPSFHLDEHQTMQIRGKELQIVNRHNGLVMLRKPYEGYEPLLVMKCMAKDMVIAKLKAELEKAKEGK